jgi:hypothetical protein
MERARATWTDERLDDLSNSVGRVGADLRQLRTEMNARVDSLEGRLGSRIDAVQGGLENRIDGFEGRLVARIDAVEGRLGARIDALNRSMLQVGGGVIVAVLAAIVNVILGAS